MPGACVNSPEIPAHCLGADDADFSSTPAICVASQKLARAAVRATLRRKGQFAQNAAVDECRLVLSSVMLDMSGGTPSWSPRISRSYRHRQKFRRTSRLGL